MGGSKGSSQTIGFRYYMSILMGISRGPIDEIVQLNVGDVRAWPVPDGDSQAVSGLAVIAKGPDGKGIAQYEDGSYKVVDGSQVNTISGSGAYKINAPDLFGGDKKEGGIAGALQVMMGSAAQIVPAFIKTMMGGRVPDFRGVTTVYFDGLITSLNPYPKKWEWRVRRTESGWDGPVWQPSLVTIWMRDGTIKAMNPAHILYEALTNRDWGRGMSRDALLESEWLQTAETLYSEGLGLCLTYNRQSELGDFVQNVLDHMGGTIYPDRATGRLALSLLRGDYDLESIPLFTFNTGLIALEEAETAAQDDIKSEVIVKWTDPIQNTERSARVQNLAARQATGAPNSVTTAYPGVPTVELALRLAQRDLKANANSLKRYKVTLDRRAWRIVPGAVFRISVPERGIHSAVLRAGKIGEAGGSDGRISVEAVLDVFGLPAASFAAAQESEWVQPSRDAVVASRRVVREATYAELVLALDPANLQLLTPDVGTIAVIAGRPTSLSQAYEVSTLPDGADAPNRGTGNFAPFVVAQNAVARVGTTTVVPFTQSSDIGLMEVGNAVQMGAEICRLTNIAVNSDGTGALTLARGCVDTLPAGHAAGTTLFVVSEEVGGDGKEYVSGEGIAVKVLPYTSSSILDPSIAPTNRVTIRGRQGRPYPPGRLRVNGVSYVAAVPSPGNIALTWAHRDRITQQDQMIAHDATSIGPETGTTYTVRVFNDPDGPAVRTVTGITGTAFTYTTAMASEDAIAGTAWFEIESVRGGITSFNHYQFSVQFEAVGYGGAYGAAYGN